MVICFATSTKFLNSINSLVGMLLLQINWTSVSNNSSILFALFNHSKVLTIPTSSVIVFLSASMSLTNGACSLSGSVPSALHFGT